MLKTNCIIALPLYKVIYSGIFVILFFLIRGLAYTEEIGPVLDSMMALLSIIFCADTYYQETRGNCLEVFELYDGKMKCRAMAQRLMFQYGFLLLLTAVGYGLFYLRGTWQHTQQSNIRMFADAMFACGISILFFGMCTFTVINLCRNLWTGIGICVVIWTLMTSTIAKKLPVWCNIFAYCLNIPDTEQLSYDWVWGKGMALLLTIFMVLLNRKLIQERIWVKLWTK